MEELKSYVAYIAVRTAAATNRWMCKTPNLDEQGRIVN